MIAAHTAAWRRCRMTGNPADNGSKHEASTRYSGQRRARSVIRLGTTRQLACPLHVLSSGQPALWLRRTLKHQVVLRGTPRQPVAGAGMEKQQWEGEKIMDGSFG